MSAKNNGTSPRTTLNVDIISDVVCPWCYVGKKHLDRAVELAKGKLPHVEFDIRWRPFQLNPQMPKEGMGREEYMTQKFGEGGPTRDFYSALEKTGTELGIKFNFEAIEFAPNTFDAHRLVHWASGTDSNEVQTSNGEGANGQTSAQTNLMTRLFEVYFEEGGDVGSRDTLIKVARQQGMNVELVEELLASDRDVASIKQQVEIAGKMGITGVPCFIVDNKYAVMGAQPSDVLLETFQTAVAEKMKKPADAADGDNEKAINTNENI